jgi:hypothetical protein
MRACKCMEGASLRALRMPSNAPSQPHLCTHCIVDRDHHVVLHSRPLDAVNPHLEHAEFAVLGDQRRVRHRNQHLLVHGNLLLLVEMKACSRGSGREAGVDSSMQISLGSGIGPQSSFRPAVVSAGCAPGWPSAPSGRCSRWLSRRPPLPHSTPAGPERQSAKAAAAAG